MTTTKGRSGRPASAEAKGKQTDIAFLLAQLGAHAAELFKERAAALDFTRPQAGLLRLIGQQPGQSQQAIAAALGTPPSRLVALAEDLERRGLIARERNPEDRRNYALSLTDAGRAALRDLGAAAASHERAITAALTDSERAQLQRLLAKLAEAHDLAPGIHPGYRKLPP